MDDSRRGPITFGLMIIAALVTLDMTVVNVALPHMMGSLSASPEQITWILTSFLVAQGAATPISGWLSQRLGVKPMLLGCIALFTVTSVWCGAATSLPEMVLIRTLQGLAAAPIVPLCQTVLLDISPPNRAGRAMALFNMAAVVSPIAGPVVGSVLTEQWSWRWCFMINLPVGAAAFLVLAAAMPRGRAVARPFDFLGFGALALAVGATQLMLDRGPSQDWLGSREIWTYVLVAAAALWVYLAHTATAERPLFPLELARIQSFVVGSILSFTGSCATFASVAIIPLMMQGVLGYPVMLTGVLSAPRGLAAVVFLYIGGLLDHRIDRRLPLLFGLLTMSASFVIMARLDTTMGPLPITLAGALQGAGQGMMSVPILTAAFVRVPAAIRADAAAAMNLTRLLGASFGIAAMQAVTIFNTERVRDSLAGHVTLDSPVVRSALGALSPATPEGALRLNAEILRQSTMIAYLDDYRAMALLTAAMAALLLLLHDRGRRGGSPASAAAPAHLEV